MPMRGAMSSTAIIRGALMISGAKSASALLRKSSGLPVPDNLKD
jgi:hypothetical protein